MSEQPIQGSTGDGARQGQLPQQSAPQQGALAPQTPQPPYRQRAINAMREGARRSAPYAMLAMMATDGAAQIGGAHALTSAVIATGVGVVTAGVNAVRHRLAEPVQSSREQMAKNFERAAEVARNPNAGPAERKAAKQGIKRNPLGRAARADSRFKADNRRDEQRRDQAWSNRGQQSPTRG